MYNTCILFTLFTNMKQKQLKDTVAVLQYLISIRRPNSGPHLSFLFPYIKAVRAGIKTENRQNYREGEHRVRIIS